MLKDGTSLLGRTVYLGYSGAVHNSTSQRLLQNPDFSGSKTTEMWGTDSIT